MVVYIWGTFCTKEALLKLVLKELPEGIADFSLSISDFRLAWPASRFRTSDFNSSFCVRSSSDILESSRIPVLAVMLLLWFVAEPLQFQTLRHLPDQAILFPHPVQLIQNECPVASS